MTSTTREGKSLAGALASVSGFIWLVVYALSWFGFVDLPSGVPSIFPAVALILVGRALRTRARRSEPELDQMVTVPEPTPPLSQSRSRNQDIVVDAASPPPPRPRPAPRPVDEQPVTTPLASPEITPPIPPTEVSEVKVKSSRELIDEARARWRKKS